MNLVGQQNLIENKSKNSEGFLHWLQSEFSERARKNPRFSLRAFAKLLDVNPSTLSQILSGKRRISVKTLQKFCRLLNAPVQLEQNFLKDQESKINKIDFYSSVYIDSFHAIADWHHTVILEMTEQKNFQADPHQISAQLGISPTEAKLSLERLIRLGLLTKINGRLKKASKKLTNFKPGETSRAHRLLQKQIIAKADEAIDQVEPEFKDITSIFMSISEENLPQARLAIQRFRHELCELLEDGEVTRVYSLSVQLIPMEKKKKENQ